MRLQLYLARAGVASRRKCEALISDGRVLVNGRVASLGDSVESWDDVMLDGHALNTQQQVYFAFNKPVNVITAMSDPRGRPCVGDYTKGLGARVFPVGRLDFDTEGLLLLTNDGELAQRLTHPSHGADKRYEALVEGRPDKSAVAALLSGVILENPREERPARAYTVSVEPVNTTVSRVHITVREGRNRVVRRMMEAVGYPVLHLKRVGVGSLMLGHLPSGSIRELTEIEKNSILRV